MALIVQIMRLDCCPRRSLRAWGRIGRLCRLYLPFAMPDRIGSVGW
jgi:hypothetical protein